MERYRKLALAALGGLAQVAASGLMPEQYKPWAAVILAIATAAGVYAVPNAVGDGEHVAP